MCQHCIQPKVLHSTVQLGWPCLSDKIAPPLTYTHIHIHTYTHTDTYPRADTHKHTYTQTDTHTHAAALTAWAEGDHLTRSPVSFTS